MDAKWSKLYDDHAPHVRAILYRMGIGDELDDLVQECFIKAWKGLESFRGESSLKTWISRIAVNVAHDHFRRKGINIGSEELDEETLAAASIEPGDSSAQDVIRRALEALSFSHREVLVLHVIEEHSVEEVGEILGIAAGTVKSRLFHARENLQKILERRGFRYE